MELSATGRVILGFLSVGPRSGYDIKQIVEKSTRFFWAASYGQIYPELKRLEIEGLVARANQSTGGRRRVTYRITATGKHVLKAWIESPEQAYELRDEGLLKLFFAGLAGDAAVAEVLERKRELHLAAIERLSEIEPAAASSERFGPLKTLEYGLGMHGFSAQWCLDTLTELKAKGI